MMAAAKLKLLVEQGATFRKVLTWKAGTPAVPVDLTGCTARMQFRADITAAAPLVTLTTENGGIVLGGALGTIELIITATTTAAFAWATAVYDLELAFASGDVRRLIYGAVTVSPEVTRD
jgi:hypothetical protein